MSNVSLSSLLLCLQRLSALYTVPVSLEQLQQYQNQLNPDQDILSGLSLRCGFQIQNFSKKICHIKNSDCPLLLQQDEVYLLLLSVKEGYRIWQSDHKQAEQWSLAQLQQQSFQIWQMDSPYQWQHSAHYDQVQKAKHWFLGSLSSVWALYFEVFIAAFFINIFALTTPLFVMNVYDRVVPNQAVETLWVLASGAVLIFVFDFILRNLRAGFIDHAAQQIDLHLSARLFKNLLQADVVNQPQSVGGFANQLQEFNSFREFFTSTSLISLLDFPFSLVFLLLIYYLGGDLVFIPLAAMALLLFMALLLQFPLAHAVKNSLRKGGERQAWLIERLHHLTSLKILSAEIRSQQQWQALSQRSLSASLRLRLWSSLMLNISVFLQQLSYVFLVVAGVYQIQAGLLSLGGLIACTLLSGRALMPLAQLANLFSRYHQAKSAFNAIDQLMIGTDKPVAHSQMLLEGHIQFKQVGFNYPDGEPVLQGLNFNIKAQEKVAIIGRVGTGKSTVAHLLHALYHAQTGYIQLDGIDIKQWNNTELRQQIAYLPQRIDLFAGTLKHNIQMAKPSASDEQISEAAKLAGLMPLIQSHRLGFNLPIGEQGRGLSGGQIQSLGLARTLLQDSAVMILDEPSNGLDSLAELQLQNNLQQACADKTLILITQRSQLLNIVDRIIVLEQGQVLADDSKDKVLQALQTGLLKYPA